MEERAIKEVLIENLRRDMANGEMPFLDMNKLANTTEPEQIDAIFKDAGVLPFPKDQISKGVEKLRGEIFKKEVAPALVDCVKQSEKSTIGKL